MKSETISKLAPALVAAQKDIGSAIKGADNPYFKSKYADLTAVIDAVKEPLNSHGISFLQLVNQNDNGGATIETTLLHESGEFITSITPVYCKKPDDPQALGSGITYSKRYALQAMLGLPTADDDGESAQARSAKPSHQKAKEITLDRIKSDKATDFLKTCAGVDDAKEKLKAWGTYGPEVQEYIENFKEYGNADTHDAAA